MTNHVISYLTRELLEINPSVDYSTGFSLIYCLIHHLIEKTISRSIFAPPRGPRDPPLDPGAAQKCFDRLFFQSNDESNSKWGKNPLNNQLKD